MLRLPLLAFRAAPLALAILAVSACGPQRAQPVVKLGYDELFARSELVLIGTVGRVKATAATLRLEGGDELAIEQVRIDVLHVLKGTAGAQVYLENYAVRGQAEALGEAALLARLQQGDPREFLFFLVGGEPYHRFTQGPPATAYSLRVLELPAAQFVVGER